MEKEEKVTRRRVTERPDDRQGSRNVRSERRERDYRDTRDDRDSETDRGIREVREGGSDMWSGSCRLLSDLIYTLGDAFAPQSRRSSRSERGSSRFDDDDSSRGLGDCVEEVGVVCRSFNRSTDRSERGREAESSERDRYSDRDRYAEDNVDTNYTSERSTSQSTTTNT